ncbi:MAG: hypothetical protein WB646_08705 [Steroidobacteraceae bacterium]
MNRRAVVQALGAGGIGLALEGCAHGVAVMAAPRSNPQPAPKVKSIPVAVWVSRAQIGTVGERFAGLSYEKASMALPRFSPDNADLIGLFTRFGRGLLRLGGNSVDEVRWTSNGAGRTAGQVGPADIDALAGFLQLSGWNVLYGVNLATSSPAAAAAEVDAISQRHI